MIVPSGAVRVLVATRPVDFRNYAECTIMLGVHDYAESAAVGRISPLFRNRLS